MSVNSVAKTEDDKKSQLSKNDNVNNDGEKLDFDVTGGLRGICSVIIVIGHFRNFFEEPEPVARSRLYAGHCPVLFFLISGLLHGYLHGKKAKEDAWKDFIIRKCWRMLPVNLLGLVLGVPNLLFTEQTCYIFPGMIGKVIDFVFSPFLLATSGIMNGVIWQGMVQMQCYIVTPFALKFLTRYLSSRQNKIVFGLVFCIIMPAIPARIFGRQLMFTPFVRVQHYMLGLMIGDDIVLTKAEQKVGARTQQQQKYSQILIDLTTASFVLWMTLSLVRPDIANQISPYFSDLYSSWEFCLPFWVFYIRYLPFVSTTSFTHRFFSIPVLKYLGKISYSTYALHVPLLRLYGYALDGFHFVDLQCHNYPLGLGVPIPLFPHFPIVFLFIILPAAQICHVMVEEKFKRGIPRKAKSV